MVRSVEVLCFIKYSHVYHYLVPLKSCEASRRGLFLPFFAKEQRDATVLSDWPIITRPYLKPTFWVYPHCLHKVSSLRSFTTHTQIHIHTHTYRLQKRNKYFLCDFHIRDEDLCFCSQLMKYLLSTTDSSECIKSKLIHKRNQNFINIELFFTIELFFKLNSTKDNSVWILLIIFIYLLNYQFKILLSTYHVLGSALGTMNITGKREPSVCAFRTLHPADEVDIQERVIKCLMQGLWESNVVGMGSGVLLSNKDN